ncbi:unnamed protein product, partial [Didymodactylos carnosus]
GSKLKPKPETGGKSKRNYHHEPKEGSKPKPGASEGSGKLKHHHRTDDGGKPKRKRDKLQNPRTKTGEGSKSNHHYEIKEDSKPKPKLETSEGGRKPTNHHETEEGGKPTPETSEGGNQKVQRETKSLATAAKLEQTL